MNNLLVTDVGDEGENVMVFTRLGPDALRHGLTHLPAFDLPFTDVLQVRDDEIQYYLFEPLWLTPAQEKRLTLSTP